MTENAKPACGVCEAASGAQHQSPGRELAAHCEAPRPPRVCTAPVDPCRREGTSKASAQDDSEQEPKNRRLSDDSTTTEELKSSPVTLHAGPHPAVLGFLPWTSVLAVGLLHRNHLQRTRIPAALKHSHMAMLASCLDSCSQNSRFCKPRLLPQCNLQNTCQKLVASPPVAHLPQGPSTWNTCQKLVASPPVAHLPQGPSTWVSEASPLLSLLAQAGIQQTACCLLATAC